MPYINYLSGTGYESDAVKLSVILAWMPVSRDRDVSQLAIHGRWIPASLPE
jgi:hypothetical protein